MAELMIKIGNNGRDPAYQDGDILLALNQRAIRCTCAEIVCDAKMRYAGFNSDGLRPLNHLAQVAWLENTSQYRFTRVSRDEVRRDNLFTLQSEILGATPNAAGEYIHVALYVERRKRHRRHSLFGTAGQEIWYGGYTDVSNAKMDTVWNAIETHSPQREVNHQLWPATPTEKREFLYLRTTDFDETRRKTLESRHVGIDDIIIRRRRYNVEWRLLGLSRSVADIEDRTKEIDVRNELARNETVIAIRKT